MAVKVTIDSALCTGHGRCYSLSPTVFDSDDDGNGRVIVDELDDARSPQPASPSPTAPSKPSPSATDPLRFRLSDGFTGPRLVNHRT